MKALNTWQRNTLHSKPCWAETAHCFSFLFHIYFTCSGLTFYNSCLEKIHYLSIHGAIQPGPTQAHTWCFTKSCSASLCQCPFPPSHHHHHHDAWTFMATWIPKATLPAAGQNEAARERGRVQKYGGQGHGWGRAIAGSPQNRTETEISPFV